MATQRDQTQGKTAELGASESAVRAAAPQAKGKGKANGNGHARADDRTETRHNGEPAARADAESKPADSADAERPVVERVRQAASAARDLRRSRMKRLIVRLALFVVLPTIVAALYYGLLASDEYESVSMFTIHSAEGSGGASLESIIGIAAASPAARDTLAVRDHILSRDMLARLNKEHGFIIHYRGEAHDFWSRLESDASFEDAYEYYLGKVNVSYDNNSGVLTLSVRAYTAERAKTFSEAILKYSEEMVNELAERARQDQIRFAKNEVREAEKRLRKARRDVLELQQERGEFNPEQTAAAALTIRTQLEAEVAKARAELTALRSYMSPESAEVIAATERVRALSGQVAVENRRLVNPKDEKGLNQSMADFEGALIEKEFATKAYESTLATLEMARAEAARQHRYLATVARPSVADEAQHPVRWLGVLTAFIASFLFLGIGSLVIAAIKEHARV